jgi:hypothetical protein
MNALDEIDRVVDPQTTRRPLSSIIARTVVTIVVLMLIAMWVYAFGFASKHSPYRIDDDAWRARAQGICEKYEAERLGLVDMDAGYIAEPTNEQMLQRADVVDAATDILVAELDEVFAVLPPSDRDQALAAEYRGYYEKLIADRRVYTARLREFDNQPYFETMVDGGPVTNVLNDFAIVNEMRACTPPGELGGDT